MFHNTGAPASGPMRALAWCLPVAAWLVYGPLGAKYAAWMLATTLAGVAVHRSARGWRGLLNPASALLLAFSGWMGMSAAWSPADWTLIGTHAWMYALPLSTLVIAAACTPQLAMRTLAQFVWASAAVGGLWFLHARGLLPDWKVLGSTINASGNQRIASSLLLALGAGLALWLSSGKQVTPIQRAAFAIAAVLAVAGLTAQDRRTGMVLLPLLLLAWAVSAPRSWVTKGVLVTAVVAAAAGAWLGSDTVRARFAEGRAELQAYTPEGAVASSWGQRARMLEQTVQMVQEQPLRGHGLGSWEVLWTERMQPGTRLSGNTTPHNDYLLVAAQGGLSAALLLLAWLLALLVRAWRAGPMGVPALMAWLTLASIALANAALRDAKFALPLLLLAGVASALIPRSDSASSVPR